MPVKNVYVTTDNQFELYVEKGIVCISLIIEDDKTDATSNSCELKFDRPTIRKLAEQILDVCKTDFFNQKIKV
jgi:hypothetical protein